MQPKSKVSKHCNQIAAKRWEKQETAGTLSQKSEHCTSAENVDSMIVASLISGQGYESQRKDPTMNIPCICMRTPARMVKTPV